MHIPKDNNFMR